MIWGWFNEEQGNITGAVNQTFEVDATIPFAAEFEGGDATITGLTVITTAESYVQIQDVVS